MTAKRKANRRNTIQTSFDNYSHRTGIMNIRSRIIAMVNATDNKIRFSFEYRVPSQFYTIGRCTGTFIYSQSHIFTKQLIMYRLRYSNRTSASGTGRIRRHYYNFPQWTEKFYQFTNTFCHDTVIIRDENQWPSIFHNDLLSLYNSAQK